MRAAPFLILAALTADATACRPAAPSATLLQVPVVAGAREAADPAIAKDPGSGDMLLAWVAGDTSGYHLYFARSSDRGAHWSAPVRVTDQQHDIRPHAEASAQMIVAGGTIALFWPSHIVVPGRRFPASHMRFSRSLDGGKSWSAARTLNDDTTRVLAGHTFHAAIARNDTMVVAWLDSRAGAEPAHGDSAVHHDGDATIYTALSSDRGATWAAQNQMHWDDACPCCRVSLAATRDGRILAAWRGHFEGSVRDPVVATLAPTPGQPTRIRADGWVFQGCPHTGPALASAEDGSTHVAWFTGKPGGAGVFYAHREAGSDGFADPVALITNQNLPAAHPALALTGNGPLIAVNLAEDGKRVLTLATVRAGKAIHTIVPNSAGADHPHIAVLPDGAALVAWTETKGASVIKLALVELGK